MEQTREYKLKERRKLITCKEDLSSSELSLAYNSGREAYQAVRRLLLDYCHKHGGNRVKTILVHSVHKLSWDGRFTSEVLAWAEKRAEKVERYLADYGSDAFTSSLHPAMLNAVARQMIEMEKERAKKDKAVR